MPQTPIRLVILILGIFGGLALAGAIGLIALGKAAPNELWMLASSAATAIGALLANPRGGDTRASDRTTTVETPSTSTVEVTPESS